MILEQYVEVGLAASNIRYYENLGYHIPRVDNGVGKLVVKHGTTIEVHISDLKEYSNAIVKIQCDYCGKIFEQDYSTYNKYTTNGNIKKACCGDCLQVKAKESLLDKYGVESGFKIDGIEEKITETMLTRYGVEHSMQIPKNREIIAKKTRLDFSEVLKRFNDVDLIPLIDESEYTGNKQLIPYKCKHHPDEIYYKNILSVTITKLGCPKCYTEKMSRENSPVWKGGVSDLKHYLRTLLDDWRTMSFKKYNYKCVLTNKNSSELQIHHLTSFNTILYNVLYKLNIKHKSVIGEYTDDELSLIKDEFLLQHNVLGVPLHRDLHILFHNLYGRGNNTPKQFEEFKIRYNVGEFNNI